MKPPKHCYDKSFRYVSAASTDIAKTFARLRREVKARADIQVLADVEAKVKTIPLRKTK